MKWIAAFLFIFIFSVSVVPYASANSGFKYEVKDAGTTSRNNGKWLYGSVDVRIWSTFQDTKKHALWVEYVFVDSAAAPRTMDRFSKLYNGGYKKKLADESTIRISFFKSGPKAITKIIFYEQDNDKGGSRVVLGTYDVK